jgi:hypothetical protein
MDRRKFLSSTFNLSVFTVLGNSFFSLPFSRQKENSNEKREKDAETREAFSRIIQRALEEEWASLPIGECMGKIGTVFIGTEYVAGTLEGKGPEVCRVDLTGLDCVTFFENALCLARIIKKGRTDFADFIKELTYTRYRKGSLTDYTSRLHYTSDWIYDNEKKRVIKDITRDIGGQKFPVEVSFMSGNPQYYPALMEFPEFITTIAGIEQEINRREHWFIPRKRIRKAQEYLQTGDIIAVATNKKGLDYAHTGLVFRDGEGRIRLLHASLKQKKVLLDTELYRYIQSVEAHIGITIARPCSVSNPEELKHDHPDCRCHDEVIGHGDERFPDKQSLSSEQTDDR